MLTRVPIPEHSQGGSGRVVLHFKDFKPFLRGKEVTKGIKPLDRSKVKRVAIMIRR
jgi:hypothetical protein